MDHPTPTKACFRPKQNLGRSPFGVHLRHPRRPSVSTPPEHLPFGDGSLRSAPRRRLRSRVSAQKSTLQTRPPAATWPLPTPVRSRPLRAAPSSLVPKVLRSNLRTGVTCEAASIRSESSKPTSRPPETGAFLWPFSIGALAFSAYSNHQVLTGCSILVHE